jgi:hypothetical protein
VLDDRTKDFSWQATPALLMADLKRAGFTLRHRLAYERNGIPGSGGTDWLRNDWEPVICVTPPGKLPWSNPTAVGHPPKYRPGGQPSHRRRDGARVNGSVGPRGHDKNGDVATGRGYTPPQLANPGNVIKCKVGCGNMGSKLCHEGEAPFAEKLADTIIRTWCPPGGVVLDPFMGTGTTGAMAVQAGRRFLGCDIRQDQVDITRRRINQLKPQSDCCLRCGQAVDYSGRGPRRRYCGDACQQAAYRARTRNNDHAEALRDKE